MTVGQAIILFVAAVLGGTLNSVAGGGSFVTFPSLIIFGGVPAIQANATSTVALWPGSVASVGAYRKDLTTSRRMLIVLGIVSVLGGVLGAVLLLHTQSKTFERLIPWLLLLATLLFAFGSKVTATLRGRMGQMHGPRWLSFVGTLVLQFIISLYGGFFGGGIGILMLATLAVLGMENIHEMNALKTVLASCINGVAVITFIVANAVFWPQALVMVLGAISGGYGGASVARKVDPKLVRRFVLLVGFGMTIYFFVRAFA